MEINNRMEDLELLVAKKLLQLKTFCLQVNSPFIWANNRKSPIYFDDRKIFSYTYMRNFIKLELSRTVAELYPDADVIAGVAVNAIAHGVLVAEQLALPYVYVHPTPKDHGLENRIEGDLRPRQKVVIIENQVYAGDNVKKVIEALRNNGCTVEGVVTIFDYQMASAKRVFHETDVALTALTNFSAVVKQAEADRTFSESDLHILQEWHKNPTKWGK